MIHDLAPLALARHRPGRGRWVWHCHADLSRAQRRAWHLVRRDLERYDAVVFSLPKFAQRVRIPILIIYPSLDPLSEKNRELSRAEVQQVLDRFGVPRDKPILLQVAPTPAARTLGVVRAYRLAKKYVDCRLVLAGGARPTTRRECGAGRDPRGAARDPTSMPWSSLPTRPRRSTPPAGGDDRRAQAAAGRLRSRRRGSDVEGKPVIGSLAGAFAQVIVEVTGFTVNSAEGAAFRIRQLLQNPDLITRMGGAAREYVRRNFLLPRHLAITWRFSRP
jgi:trehalose synthase